MQRMNSFEVGAVGLSLPQLVFRAPVLLLVLSVCAQLPAQTGTAPEEGIQARPARVTLFRNAHIVISPERELDKADLLVRDDKITDVAATIEAPVDAQIIDCQGKYLYPALVDALVEQSAPAAERPDDHWNSHIQPHRQVHATLASDDKTAALYRRAGFGTILIAPSDGILKGTSAVVTTAKLPVAKTALRTQAFQHLALVLARQQRGGYPNSPMGVIALTRQTLSDAQWYQQAQQAFRADPSLPAPDKNVALDALGPLVRGEQAVIIDSGNELYALRADRMAREFNLSAIIRGSGREYRRLDALAALGRTWIVPVDFPKPPEVGSIEAAAAVSLQSLMHWYLAPENPGRLEAAGVQFVLTASGLSSPNEMLESVRKAIGRGLSERRALEALTLRPAKLLEVEHLVGTLERGKLANLLIASGPLWEKKTTLEETWVQGERYRWKERSELDASGRWKVQLTGGEGVPEELELELESMTDKPKGRLAIVGQLDKPPKPAAAKGEDAKQSATDAKVERAQADVEKSQEKDPKKSVDEQTEKKEPSDKPEKPLELKKPTADVPPKDDNQPDKPKPAAQPDVVQKESESKPQSDAPPERTSNAKSESSLRGDAARQAAAEKEAAANVAELKRLGISDFRIEGLFEPKNLKLPGKGSARLSLTILAEGDEIGSLLGRIQWPDGQTSTLIARRSSSGKANQAQEKPTDERKPNREKSDDEKADDEKADDEKASQRQGEDPNGGEKASSSRGETDDKLVCDVNYPLGAFGVAGAPEQPEWLLVRGATIWTCDAPGVIEGGDLLVHRGKIKEVGRDLVAPEGAEIIDAKGKNISPGIIDCHSHMATDGGVNESGQAVTAEVRIGDFIDCNDMTIYQQLAGGVTAANILHGSANPIGGQNQVVKLRWGALDDEMKMHEAPAGIKFALGENVKQSNWGDRATGRYPQTRMGVEQIMRDRFEAAKLYREAHSPTSARGKTLPPRRDYELEAIVDILEHRRWIHCHSYRQDEILTFLRTLEDYGVTVGTLQHILEGYKVADEMARHGAMASTFSDWWAYKFEVLDAIPFNGALMYRAGIVVSFNSDDDELGRHLNHEAAKAIKYGGVTPEEALKFVTLNPAKQLRIDQHVGSLAPGKQADFVIWSGSPLSTLSRCEQTWIDGRKYFDREVDAQERTKAAALHRTLVQRILDSGEKMVGDGRDRRDPSLWFERHDEFCHHSSGQDQNR